MTKYLDTDWISVLYKHCSIVDFERVGRSCIVVCIKFHIINTISNHKNCIPKYLECLLKWFECWRCPLCNGKHLSSTASNNRLQYNSIVALMDECWFFKYLHTNIKITNTLKFKSIHITIYIKILWCVMCDLRPIERIYPDCISWHSLIHVKCNWIRYFIHFLLIISSIILENRPF